MNLSEITPKEVKFTVSKLELIFRPFTINDDLKAQEICGGQDQLGKAFEKFDFTLISLIAWYQLTLDSQKSVIKNVQLGFHDPDTGRFKQTLLKPINKFRQLFLGIGDQISLITNLIKCKGINIPDFDDEEKLKKWTDQFAKILPSTGQ